MDLELLRTHFTQTPPNTAYIKQILEEFKNGLLRFVPSKTEVHQFIKDDLPLDTLTVESIPHIIDRLIHWMEQFQAPAYDYVTKQWRDDFVSCTNYTDFICKFVEEYREHSEIMYKTVWDARKRISNNESAIPPDHLAKGTNGVPDDMKSGRK